MSDALFILEIVRDASARGDGIAEALARSGIPASDRVEARMAAGEPAAAALAAILPARLAQLLEGDGPPFPVRCALAADEEHRRLERQRILVEALSYPCAMLAVLILLLAALRWWLPRSPHYHEIVTLRVCLLPLAALALVGLAQLGRSGVLPGSGWRRHLALAERWARAALTVDWRLTELQAQRLLGVDLSLCGDVLSSPTAADHCRQLASWHLRSARRLLLLTAWATAALVLLTGGAIVLASVRIYFEH